MAMRQITSGKAAGHDNIPAEAMKSDIKIKTASVSAVSASVGLNIHKGKTKVLKYNTEHNNPITLDGKILEDVESFTHLGSIVDEQGGSDADIEARIGKSRTLFL
ncbi:unnamed protein product [Schistosoma margrebowiei]|uniref:Uncharacterized protein n=1 Tax=Schistosoma margrebowiei TaxID=48269 RepID=A0A183N7F4_9TREM|nr:unnamed protein product [Schistosoma margrebowiei]